jgi:hypothetical protein
LRLLRCSGCARETNTAVFRLYIPESVLLWDRVSTATLGVAQSIFYYNSQSHVLWEKELFTCRDIARDAQRQAAPMHDPDTVSATPRRVPGVVPLGINAIEEVKRVVDAACGHVKRAQTVVHAHVHALVIQSGGQRHSPPSGEQHRPLY